MEERRRANHVKGKYWVGLGFQGEGERMRWGGSGGELDGRGRALMRTASRGQPDKRMRAGGSEVGSVCPNWLTELLKYPCSNYSHKEQLLAIERSHWATFVHTGRQQTTGFMFV